MFICFHVPAGFARTDDVKDELVKTSEAFRKKIVMLNVAGKVVGAMCGVFVSWGV